MMSLLLPVGMIVIFYFLLIRPQNQRMKKHRAMIAAMKKGDTVVTQGGIIGRIFKLADDEVTIDTGEGGKLRIVRGMIVEVKNSPARPRPTTSRKADPSMLLRFPPWKVALVLRDAAARPSAGPAERR